MSARCLPVVAVSRGLLHPPPRAASWELRGLSQGVLGRALHMGKTWGQPMGWPTALQLVLQQARGNHQSPSPRRISKQIFSLSLTSCISHVILPGGPRQPPGAQKLNSMGSMPGALGSVDSGSNPDAACH